MYCDNSKVNNKDTRVMLYGIPVFLLITLKIFSTTFNTLTYCFSIKFCSCILLQHKIPVAYSEAYQTSKMEHFAKIVDGCKPYIIYAKNSILDV